MIWLLSLSHFSRRWTSMCKVGTWRIVGFVSLRELDYIVALSPNTHALAQPMSAQVATTDASNSGLGSAKVGGTTGIRVLAKQMEISRRLD